MKVKSTVKGLIALNIAAVIATAAATWFLGGNTVAEWLDTAAYVGLGMGALGALMFAGSSAGIGASTGMAASAADRPGALMNALWGDRNAGISTGALFVLGGVSWLAIAWLVASLLGWS